MPKVRLWNDNKLDHRELYKGDQLHIPAGKFIVMEEEDAIQFRGQWFPVVRDADGQALPQSYKMLRMEKIQLDEAAPKPEGKESALTCQACKYKADSDADLKEHLGTHKDALLVDEEAEAEIRTRKRKTG